MSETILEGYDVEPGPQNIIGTQPTDAADCTLRRKAVMTDQSSETPRKQHKKNPSRDLDEHSMFEVIVTTLEGSEMLVPSDSQTVVAEIQDSVTAVHGTPPSGQKLFLPGRSRLLSTGVIAHCSP